MQNHKIADAFELLADLLEFKGENPFKLRAYRNASRVIRDLGQEVSEIVLEDSSKLTQLEGIGKAVAEKTETLVRTGKLPQLEAARAEIPESVLEILRVPQVGPKKAAQMFHELNIQTLEQLKAACEAGELRQLKGFGAKTEQAILDGIEIAAAAAQRIYWSKADALVEHLRDHFRHCTVVEKLEFAGSYRRGKETVGDLDILVVATESEPVMDHFATLEEIKSTIGRGDTKMSVRLGTGFQVDLRVVPAESFGAALQYFTGSKEHNVAVRGRAKQLGLKVNEWGVFRVEDETQIAGGDEREIYRVLDLPWVPPELRENRGEFDSPRQQRFDRLLDAGQLLGDLHMHTTETDGKSTLQEMVAAAQNRGLKYIAITDHSKRVTMARGLDEERLLVQWQAIDELNRELEGEFRVLKGIECDILEKGGLDLEEAVLAQADWVLASVHYGQQQPKAQITDRIIGAIESSVVHAIAHPTGRIINRRPPYEVDFAAVCQAAKENGKALELNANPARLDLDDVHCSLASELGIPIVINSDAHHTEGMDVIRFGLNQARRAGLTADDVLNTRDVDSLLAHFS